MNLKAKQQVFCNRRDRKHPKLSRTPMNVSAQLANELRIKLDKKEARENSTRKNTGGKRIQHTPVHRIFRNALAKFKSSNESTKREIK